MRNSSDIFCLKELNEGDTSGMEMFSVNGKCQLAKLNRRRNLHSQSSSFEYGSLSTGKKTGNSYNRELLQLTVDQDDQDDRASSQLNKLSSIDEKGDQSRKQHVNEDDLKSFDNGITMQQQQQHVDDGFEQKDQHLPPPTQPSVSSMTRNPLTGSGMETQNFKRSKKGASTCEKWVW